MNLEFNSEIWFWQGPAPYYCVTAPAEQSRDLKAVAKVVTYGWA
jgi:hypothetical protein